MRLLRYGDDGHGLSVDFHPDLTVLSGLRPIEEARVVRALRAALSGHPVEVPLEVEIDDDVVRLAVGDRIPEANLHALDCVGQAEQLAEFAAERDSSIAAPRHRLMAADRAVLVLEESVAATRAQHDQLAAERRRLEHEIEVITHRIEAMESETDEQRITAMVRTQIEHLRRHAEYLRDLPVADLVRSTEALCVAIGDEPVPNHRAQELADQWAAVATRSAELEAKLAAEGRSPDEFAARMEAAQRTISAEESPLRPGSIDRDLAEQLEAAHEAVLEAESKRRRFLAGKAARRIEEAHEAERELLDELGFSTWTGYVMGTVGMDTGDRAERLRVAQEELAALEAEWEALSAELAADPEYSALFEEMDVLYAEAVELIGEEPEGDVEETLRALTVERDPQADPEALAFKVIAALRHVGVAVDDEVEVADLVEQAEHVVQSLSEGSAAADEQAGTADRLEAMLAHVESDDGSIEALALELGDELATDGVMLDSRIDELSSELATLEEKIAEADELIVARLTLRDTAVAATRRTAIEVVEMVAAVGELPELAQNEYLAHRLRGHLDDDDIPPLVLDHAFVGYADVAEPLAMLEAQLGVVQMILVTGRPEVGAWADALGVGQALVLPS